MEILTSCMTNDSINIIIHQHTLVIRSSTDDSSKPYLPNLYADFLKVPEAINISLKNDLEKSLFVFPSTMERNLFY